MILFFIRTLSFGRHAGSIYSCRCNACLFKRPEYFLFNYSIKDTILYGFWKPIISMINGIGNEIIKEANCGFTANAGDFESLANNVKRLSRMDKNMLYEKGEPGRNIINYFCKEKIIDNLIEVFQSE